MTVLEMLKSGNFNSMEQRWQPDGSVILTLQKRGDEQIYKAHVKDLYGENEEVIEDA